MYSTVEDYEIAMGETIDNYNTRELIAVATLKTYCLQFPLESEMATLEQAIQDQLILAIYYQIKYEYDNDLLEDNAEITAAVIGKFSYDIGSKYGDAQPLSKYSNTATKLVRTTGICNNRVTVKKNCSWLESVLECLQ